METHVPVKVQSLRDPHGGGGHRKAGREVASPAVAARVSCGAGGRGPVGSTATGPNPPPREAPVSGRTVCLTGHAHRLPVIQ